MKIRFYALVLMLLCLVCFASSLMLVSCQEDPKIRILEQQKEAKKQEVIFNNISKGWNFNSRPVNLTAGSLTNNWTEWRLFLNELGQKPKSSIGAFKQKARTLSKKAADLNNNIPGKFAVPEVKSRIAAINTKINAINLYINLQQIPDSQIVKLVQEINAEVASLQFQLDEITRKSNIKIEEGENDMLRMLDTTRAIPSKPKVLNSVK
ncbi:hypothetical protein [Flavobacterium sp. J49]|uniref:hypothetical protein n=1 Tax=Flavobacterium sp. J49 TaxID=2718534 RepID=UPI001E3A290D|nr:hypothetical protein [Flavobacterium sp. J49]